MKRVAVAVVVVVIAVVIWQCAGRRSTRSVATTARSGTASALPVAGAAQRDERPPPAWFVVRGAPSRRIAGRVTLRGEPVADATVALHSMLARMGAATPVELRTGPDGRFDFGLRPPAPYDIAAQAAGTTAAIVHVDLSDPVAKPPADQLELRLRDCPVFVEGTVYDAAGNPLPKAQVRRDGLSGITTDARGAYKLCVPFGDVQIDYAADGYGAVTLTIDARGEMQRDVVLVPEATILVRVVRRADGEPVADAAVWARPKQWAPDHPRVANVVTDADGRVVIDGLVPGRYRVGAFADGLTAEAPEEVIAEVGTRAEVTVRLDTTATVRGKVVSGGKPVAGARVGAVRKSPSTRSPPAMSQADGTFVLERVPVGEIVFVAPPHEVVSPTLFETEAGRTYDVVLDVRALGTIRGRITRLGKPVEGVHVCCVRTPHSFEPATDTDAEGRYEFRGVPAGTYNFGAGSDEIGAFTLGGKVTLAAGEEKIVDFELDQAGTIAGTVVDRAGKPVRGVFVRWIHEKTADICRAVTDAQGRYRCGAMTGGGKYRAAVFPSAALQQVPYPTADGSPYPVLEVADGKTVIENVKLAIDRPDLSIEGHVIDDAGRPIADAVVKALPHQGGTPQFHAWLRLPLTSTDTDGKFTLDELAPGNYALSARAVDGAEGVSPPIAAGTTNAVVRVERAAAIEGKLVGYTQPPVVYARPAGGAFSLQAGVVDGTAAFRVTGLRPGRYLVNAMTTYEGDAQIVELRPGETAKIVMTARGRGTIEGTVLDFRTRAPLANAICHAVMSVDGEQSITNWDLTTAPRSDDGGRVLIDPAPAGTVDVVCEMPTFRWSRPSATIALAARTRASVELLSVELTQENGGTIGIVFDWRTTPPRIARVAPNSPAAKAGLLAGDLVTAVDGVAVKGLNGAGVQQLIASTPMGSEVRVQILRGTAVKTVVATVVAE